MQVWFLSFLVNLLNELCGISNRKVFLENNCYCTKNKASIEDLFKKCDQIRNFLQISSHLLKKSLTENFMFSTVCFKGYVCYFICSTKLKSLKKIEKNVSFHQKNSFYSRDIQLFLIFLFFFSNIFHSKKNLNNEMIILDYPETTVN